VSDPPAIVAQGGLSYLRELERVLGAAGLAADIVAPRDASLNA